MIAEKCIFPRVTPALPGTAAGPGQVCVTVQVLLGRLCSSSEAISGYEETASLLLAVTLASKILRLQILPFWTNTFDQFNLFPSGISMGWFADTPPAPYARVPAQFCCLTGKYGCCVILNLPSQG